jgi:hypothetical protein
MDKVVSAPWLAVTLFVGMVVLMETGRRLRLRQIARGLNGELPGLGTVEAAVFGLLGLMVAFSFSGAAGRFELRRDLVVQEANAIGTAYLRLDLLAPSDQPALRARFRSYVDSRLETYRKLPDIEAAEKELAHTGDIQGEIWTQAIADVRNPQAQTDSAKLLLPALNDMIDITTTRTMAARSHPPPILFYLLLGLGFVASLLAGYGMGNGDRRSWLHVIGFAAVTAIVIFVILDLEYPRMGYIRLDAYDRVLVELRNSMK